MHVTDFSEQPKSDDLGLHNVEFFYLLSID